MIPLKCQVRGQVLERPLVHRALRYWAPRRPTRMATKAVLNRVFAHQHAEQIIPSLARQVAARRTRFRSSAPAGRLIDPSGAAKIQFHAPGCPALIVHQAARASIIARKRALYPTANKRRAVDASCARVALCERKVFAQRAR